MFSDPVFWFKSFVLRKPAETCFPWDRGEMAQEWARKAGTGSLDQLHCEVFIEVDGIVAFPKRYGNTLYSSSESFFLSQNRLEYKLRLRYSSL